MSSGSRQKAMRSLVVLVLLWPIPHRVLVERFDVDPWELFGWAMYSEPAARVQIRVDRIEGDLREPWRAMGSQREAIRDFARRRTILGQLASPDALASRLLEEQPEADGLVVVMRRIRLDPASRFVIAEHLATTYRRGDAINPRPLCRGHLKCGAASK